MNATQFFKLVQRVDELEQHVQRLAGLLETVNMMQADPGPQPGISDVKIVISDEGKARRGRPPKADHAP